MDSLLYKIQVSLSDLGTAILNLNPENRTISDFHGNVWNQVSLSKFDLAEMAFSLASRINDANPETLDEILREKLILVPQKLESLRSRTLPQFFTGNGNVAVPIFMSTLAGISNLLSPVIGWQILQDNKAMPAQLSSRLRAIQAQLKDIVPNKEELELQVKLIRDAVAAAESLPTDLESLKQARNEVREISSNAAELYGKIGTYNEKAFDSLNWISKNKEDADKLVERCEEAYRITTTKGLAAAFDERAVKLSKSMWSWVVILVVALGIGAFIGYRRVDVLSSAIKEADPKWGIIWMHIALSVVSISAPIWVAWLATKQIAKRFQLSEDYAYKASVAKAYEGYRKEAARIDPAMEARLFSSALTRLEEAPLRLLDNDPYGSPWHELLASPGFQKAMNAIPELKDTFVKIFKADSSEKADVKKIIAKEQEN
jgi:hypothetical protein